MRTARSHSGVTIRLNDERWAHILLAHPEMDGRIDDVLRTVSEPEWIWEGSSGELIAGRKEDDLYLLAAYREIDADDGFVLTAFLTRRPGRRKLIWKR